MSKIILLPILIPLFAGIFSLFAAKKARSAVSLITLAALFITLVIALKVFRLNLSLVLPWAGWGGDFSLRLYHFSAFINLAAAAFGFLIALYSRQFLKDKPYSNQFYGFFLLSVSFVSGACLSDNLLLMLFFWEGLLVTLFGLIAIGSPNAYKCAAKALIIVGISDLCMMVGIALTAHLSGTLTISSISLPLDRLGLLAFTLLMIGAIAKAGSMPFHSWIPDAAVEAPLPFMAFLPAALEKLLGIYFLTRICMDLFKLTAGSFASTMLMVIGAITIIFAVMMALIQKDFKKLLSYHAISQVGYMVLGLGTAVPAGIVGGLFHMINHAMYKSCLFLTGGSVEKQAGTTNLEKLGGIGKKMPVTFICFIITAASISGAWPFNGFFSKELIYDGALERGVIFYIAAVVGSFFTAASFLKLGHAAFMGKANPQLKDVKESPLSMLLPMIVIALGCIIFGVFNFLPLQKLIQPVFGAHVLEGHDFSGMPKNVLLVVISFVVLIAAVLNHLWGAKKKASGLHALDHIRFAPVLDPIYNKAEKGLFDPYLWGTKCAEAFSKIAWFVDRSIDWIYERFVVVVAEGIGRQIKRAHTGNYSVYLAWSMAGFLLVVVYLIVKG